MMGKKVAIIAHHRPGLAIAHLIYASMARDFRRVETLEPKETDMSDVTHGDLEADAKDYAITVLIQQLRAFAQGCRGSMWQSRDETIRLMDEAATALSTAQTEAAELRAEVERLREALRSTQWTVANQTVAKALCEAVAVCALGPSDDEGILTLYDIIPDVWCVPDRFAATNDIAEQIAFTALEAWLTAARATLTQGTPHE